MAPVARHQQGQPAPPPPPAQPAAPADPRETAEYKAALELEMWKEQHVRDFESQVKPPDGISPSHESQSVTFSVVGHCATVLDSNQARVPIL